MLGSSTHGPHGPHGTAVLARCLLVGASVTAGAATASVLLLPATHDLSAPGFGDVLTSACATVLLICTGWAWLASTAVVVEALRTLRAELPPSGPIPGVPGWVRRLVLATCGVAVAVGAAGPAGAATVANGPGPGTPWSQGALEAVHAPASGPGLGGLPMPDRPSGVERAGGAGVLGPGSVPAAAPGPQHLVERGDTLWDIAEQRLGPRADEASVAAYVVRLHAANQPVLGTDPDLILPGQALRLPPS